jgi:predicted molibdopterin-dependent oxidoreductase YjgC
MTQGPSDCIVVVTNAPADEAPVTSLRGKREMRHRDVKGEGCDMSVKIMAHELWL